MKDKKSKRNNNIKKAKEIKEIKTTEITKTMQPTEEIKEANIKKKANTTNKKQTKKIAIYLLLLIASTYVCYTIYLLIKQPTDTFTVEEGKLYLEETDIGYVIREEVVVQGENYKNGMEQIRTEGEKAGKDEAIFRYYSTNETSLKEKIAELDTKIQETMANDTSLYSSDMKLLENQIDEKVQDIKGLTDTAKLNEYKKEIEELVTKKAKTAGELSPKGSYLNQLINERKEYENQLNSGAEYVKAPMSGIVSYRVDGLESQLTPENFGALSKNYLENLNLKTGKIVSSNDEAGKVINNFYCYIATITSSEKSKEAKVDDKLKVRLSNNNEVPAQITNIIEEEDGSRVLILKIEKDIQELTNYRKISFDLIWWSYSGLKVPNQAIVDIDGLKYVARNRAGYINKLLVKVEKQNDSYSIVEPYETKELKELGFSNQEIYTYIYKKTISIYDEILLNPNMDKIE